MRLIPVFLAECAGKCGSERYADCLPRPSPEVIKLFFFVLNSVVHEILNAHKYKNIKKFGLFRA